MTADSEEIRSIVREVLAYFARETLDEVHFSLKRIADELQSLNWHLRNGEIRVNQRKY